MRKINIILGILVLFLFITGCSSQNKDKTENQYKGESNNWKVEYAISRDGEHFERNLKLTYKGELTDLQSLESLKYSYKAAVSNGNGEIPLGKDINTKVFEIGVSGEGEFIVKEDKVSVTITLNQETETINLE